MSFNFLFVVYRFKSRPSVIIAQHAKSMSHSDGFNMNTQEYIDTSNRLFHPFFIFCILKTCLEYVAKTIVSYQNHKYLISDCILAWRTRKGV